MSWEVLNTLLKQLENNKNVINMKDEMMVLFNKELKPKKMSKVGGWKGKENYFEN